MKLLIAKFNLKNRPRTEWSKSVNGKYLNFVNFYLKKYLIKRSFIIVFWKDVDVSHKSIE